MTPDAFSGSLSEAAPPEGLNLALQALWWAGKGQWEQAHACVQQQEGTFACDWVHAYLHRQEGDLSNARYWYRRAGQPVTTAALQDEWAAISTRLLTEG